jgi:probable HAF family extracellular repeat protein
MTYRRLQSPPFAWNEKNTLLMAVLDLIMSTFTAYAAPIPIYSVTDIGFLPGDTVMRGAAISLEGDIVGSGYTSFQRSGGFFGGGSGANQHGFLYHHRKLTDLGAGVVPIKINNFEEILETTPNGSVVFEYKNRRSTPLPNEGIDLNNAGQVLLKDNNTWGGYVSIWQPSGAVSTHLVGIQGDSGNYFEPFVLNDLGQVVGRDFTIGLNGLNNVVLVQPSGKYQTIASSTSISYVGPDYVFPRATNLLGQAVGIDVNAYWNYFYEDEFYDSGDAALYENGQNILLGNLITQAEGGAGLGGQPPGSQATGINTFGVIVGYCQGVGLHQSLLRAFVYLNGTMYDLNTLVNSTSKGLSITEAWAINDLGQIVALANDNAGNTHTVLLSVVGLEDSDVPK